MPSKKELSIKIKSVEMSKMKIQLRDIAPPSKGDEDADLEWLCQTLGLFTKKDCDGSAQKVFTLVVKGSIEGEPKTSTEIAENLGLTRGAVLFHMKKFSASGLVRQGEGRKYVLRDTCLEDTVSEMMRDAQRCFERMRKVAAEIDRELGVEKRW